MKRIGAGLARNNIAARLETLFWLLAAKPDPSIHLPGASACGITVKVAGWPANEPWAAASMAAAEPSDCLSSTARETYMALARSVAGGGGRGVIERIKMRTVGTQQVSQSTSSRFAPFSAAAARWLEASFCAALR